MRWAIIDAEDFTVLRLVESEDKPSTKDGEQAVKGHDESAAIGLVWDGWGFQEAT